MKIWEIPEVCIQSLEIFQIFKCIANFLETWVTNLIVTEDELKLNLWVSILKIQASIDFCLQGLGAVR